MTPGLQTSQGWGRVLQGERWLMQAGAGDSGMPQKLDPYGPLRPHPCWVLGEAPFPWSRLSTCIAISPAPKVTLSASLSWEGLGLVGTLCWVDGWMQVKVSSGTAFVGPAPCPGQNSGGSQWPPGRRGWERPSGQEKASWRE